MSIPAPVRERAADRCEYCRMRQEWEAFYPYHVEHIVAQQHRGSVSLRKEVLDAVVALRPTEEDDARYHELADKNAESTIIAEERAELESIVSGNTVLSLLRNEAKPVLQQR